MKGNYQAVISAAGAAYSYVAPYFSRLNRTSGLQEYSDGRFGFAAGSSVVTLNKKKKQRGIDAMQHFSRMRGRYGRNRRRTLGSRVSNLEEKIIDRWQGVSRFGKGGGFYRIYKGLAANSSPNVVFPFHCMDLSYMPYNTIGGATFNGLRVFFQDPTTTPLQDTLLQSQISDGTTTTAGQWVPERGEVQTDVPSIFHKWTQIKLNLYGTLFRPIKYKVFLFKMNPDATFGYTTNSDDEMRLAFESVMKPYLYSNLIGNCGEQKKYLRILKQWNFNFDPVSKSDAVDAANTNYNPHFKEVKLFIRHGMKYNYEWYDVPTKEQVVTDLPNVDTFHTSPSQVNAHAPPGSRLFLGIIATCSDSMTPLADEPYNSEASDTYVKKYGSYDMVVRRCYTYSKVH